MCIRDSTTRTHNNKKLKYQKPTENHSSNQPEHKYSTRPNIKMTEDGKNMIPKTCSVIIYLEVK